MIIVWQNHKMVIVRVLGIVTLWAVTLLPASAHSQGGSDAPDVLLVGTIFAPPASMKSTDGQWEGLSIELWQRVAQRLGVQYELLLLSNQ